MLNQIRELRAIGPFEAGIESNPIDIKPLVIIYAQNGRGKTTLCEIMQSLSDNDSSIITNRKRIGSSSSPQVRFIDSALGRVTFSNDAWNKNIKHIRVYDDFYISKNVFQGLTVEASTRQKLAEVVLGEQGVRLAQLLRDISARSNRRSSNFQAYESSLSKWLPFGYTVDEFVDLESLPRDTDLRAEFLNSIRIAENSESIKGLGVPKFPTIPLIDDESFRAFLEMACEDIQREAVSKILEHISKHQNLNIDWFEQGHSAAKGECPFCNQDLDNSDIADYYTQLFSDSYRDHIKQLRSNAAAYEALVSDTGEAELRQGIKDYNVSIKQWSNYTSKLLPSIVSHTVISSFRQYQATARALVARKLRNPLGEVAISESEGLKLESWVLMVNELNAHILSHFEELLAECKQIKSAAASVTVAQAKKDYAIYKLCRLRARKSVERRIGRYEKLKSLKNKISTTKQNVRNKLNDYRKVAFSKYSKIVNAHLHDFGVSFRLGQFEATDSAGIPSMSWGLTIMDEDVPLNNRGGGPEFKNTLSAGDRSTLAFAFFLASLHVDNNLGECIVVIDDPVNSMDNYRLRQTLSKICSLAENSSQCIMLTHRLDLAQRFIKETNHLNERRTLLHIKYSQNHSSIIVEDVPVSLMQDANDERYASFIEFVEGASSRKELDIAKDIRPHLETAMRVRFPGHYSPGEMLRAFIDRVRSSLDTSSQLMSKDEFRILTDINDFAKEFHHDENEPLKGPREVIETQELLTYVKMLLDFIKCISPRDET